MSHSCSVCSYTTVIKANYNKHLLTQKHLLKCQNLNIVNQDNSGNMTKIDKADESDKSDNLKSINESTQSQPIVNPTQAFVCKFCEQSFKFKQSMYKHIKYSCKNNNDLTKIVSFLKLQVELKDKQIEQLIEKIK
jgi:hypothetical protein